MKETQMWQKLKDCFNDLVPYGIIERIESPITIGLPDVHFRTAEHEGWIELKQLKQRRDHWVVPFQPGQFVWLTKYCNLNGTSVLVATIGNNWYCFIGGEIRERYYTLDGYDTCPLGIIQLIIGMLVKPVTAS